MPRVRLLNPKYERGLWSVLRKKSVFGQKLKMYEKLLALSADEEGLVRKIQHINSSK